MRPLTQMLVIVSLLLSGCEKSDERKAQDLLDLKMYAEAKTLLQVAIPRDAKNAQLQYLLGTTELALGSDEAAKLPLQRAAELSDRKKPLIAKAYLQRSAKLLQEGNPTKAKDDADLAAGYDPAIKPELGKLFLDQGQAIAQSNFQFALLYFQWATLFDPSQKSGVGRSIMEHANQHLKMVVMDGPILASLLGLFTLAGTYDPILKKPSGKALFDRASELTETAPLLSLALYEDAIKFDSSLTQNVSAKLVADASAQLRENAPTIFVAFNQFEAAVKFDPTAKAAVSVALLDAIQRALSDGQFSRATSIVKATRNFTEDKDGEIAAMALAWAKAAASKPDKADQIIDAANFVSDLSKKDMRAWATISIEAMRNTKPTDAVIAGTLASLAVKFDPEQKQPVARFLADRGIDALKGPLVDVAAASVAFNQAVELDETMKAPLGEVVWEEFARRLQNRKELGVANLQKFCALGMKLGVPDRFRDSVFVLALALQKYVEGNKSQAMAELDQLSKSKADSWYGRAAAEIVSPPAPGVRAMSTSGDLGNGLNITLAKVEIRGDGFSLTFRLRNTLYANRLLYSPVTRAATMWAGQCEKLFVIDDNGAKYEALAGFRGGRQSEMNSCAMQIELPVGQLVEVTVDFPMISRGATNVKFVSPNPDNAGHQGEWSLANISLKGGPFD